MEACVFSLLRHRKQVFMAALIILLSSSARVWMKNALQAFSASSRHRLVSTVPLVAGGDCLFYAFLERGDEDATHIPRIPRFTQNAVFKVSKFCISLSHYINALQLPWKGSLCVSRSKTRHIHDENNPPSVSSAATRICRGLPNHQYRSTLPGVPIPGYDEHLGDCSAADCMSSPGLPSHPRGA
jgi:hypothetical protein